MKYRVVIDGDVVDRFEATSGEGAKERYLELISRSSGRTASLLWIGESGRWEVVMGHNGVTTQGIA